jgi:hypothetical protein
MNVGADGAPAAQATIPLPQGTGYISASLGWAGGGQAEVVSGTIQWAGPLTIDQQITVTYQLTLPTSPVHPPLYSVAFLEDGVEGAWERPTWLMLTPWEAYLPLVMRGENKDKRN